MNSEKILLLFKEILSIEENISESTVFDAFLYDSFAKINLIVTIENLSNTHIVIDDFLNCKTFGDLIKLCHKNN